MREDIFERRIQSTRDWLRILSQHAGRPPSEDTVVAEMVRELTTAMEELHVAAEELRQANEELLASQAETEFERQRYRELFHLAPDGYIVTDTAGVVTEANRAATDLLSVRAHRLLGKPLVLFVAREDHQAFIVRLTHLAAGGEIKDWELQLQPRGGTPLPASVAVATARDGDGAVVGLRWLIRDIRQRKQAEERMTFLAYHDQLTGLPNRTMLEELLGLALARATRHGLGVAVLCMDLDNFKLINDSLGHNVGDELLRQVSTRLREVARETDSVVRLGGDEFLVLLADLEMTDPTVLMREGGRGVLAPTLLAARIQECLRSSFNVAGTEIYTSASLGISIYPLDANDGRTLLSNADAAMYRSKKIGPGGCLLFSEAGTDSKATFSLATGLQKAVEQSNWVLHYQPIVDLVRREVIGVEALVRWRGPAGELILPQQFIKLAEDLGLINAIGDWVLEELCRQWQAWRGGGLDLNVSLNLSARQLRHPGLAVAMLDRLSSAGLDPTSVTIEITESAAMTETAERALWELHEGGLHLAIDDFGTGYSSLSRLRQVPIDVIKIDRSLVSLISSAHDEGPMVTAVIQLARSLGILPVAEGIETEDQLRYLVGKGCTLGQGHLFSQPVPGDQIASRFLDKGLRLAPDGAG